MGRIDEELESGGIIPLSGGSIDESSLDCRDNSFVGWNERESRQAAALDESFRWAEWTRELESGGIIHLTGGAWMRALLDCRDNSLVR